MASAQELEVHAKEELDHALIIATQIDYLGSTLTVTPNRSSCWKKQKPCSV